MKQSTSRKCDDQEDIRISWNTQVHHRAYNRPKQKPYPTSNGFNPHGHTPISTINLVHMATLLYLRSIQSTQPHSYIYDQLSPQGHILMSTINSVHMATLQSISMIHPVHMATFLCPQSIQSTWPHPYTYDQLSPHGNILMSTIN
jgi:hypothetical protein